MELISLFESANEVSWNKKPVIGWWLDKDVVTFYHGTNMRSLHGILETGLYAPKTGPTAGWVSLALSPNTAKGYASMSGGESAFRSVGVKARHVPMNERVVFVLKIPQAYFLPLMAEARGNMAEQRDKLKDKNLYKKFKEQYPGWPDDSYYDLTEIRLPKYVPLKFITGWMKPS